MKRQFIIIALLVMPGLLFAGTFFEADKKTYDPYLADRGGFDSLFVNPAGMAGQTELINIELNVGTFGKLQDYRDIETLISQAQKLEASDGSFDQQTAEEMIPLVADRIDVQALDDLVNGTGLDAFVDPVSGDIDIDGIEAYIEGGSLTAGEVTQIQSNFDSDPDKYLNAMDDIDVNVSGEVKAGTLIAGIGGGMYAHTSSIMTVGARGFSNIFSELGIIGGWGFQLLPGIDVGVSGNYGILTKHDDYNLDNSVSFYNWGMSYGYSWGIDAGVIWRPNSSLRVGAVLNDIIGSTQSDYPYYASGGLSDLFGAGDGIKPPRNYEFDVDLDMGVTWAPEWRVVRPQFHLDYYDVIGSFKEEQYGLDEFLNHTRIGANVELLRVLNVGAQYYQRFYSLGLGVDLFVAELYADVKFDDSLEDVGGNVRLKISL